MASLTNIDRRLANLEQKANMAGARWFTAKDGVIPDEFRPGIDSLIAVTIVDPETDRQPLMWRGEPYSSADGITINIGGE